MRTLFVSILVLASTTNYLLSQSIGIAEQEITPHGSAALEIRTTTKGLLIPRLSMNERIGIENPARGLLVYQPEGESGFYYFDGASWYNLSDAKNDLDPDPQNEIQILSIDGDQLSLSNGGGTVTVSGGTAQSQSLALNGDTLSISGSNYVLLRTVRDNLGNHQAEENLQTQGNYISSDGDNEGILVNPSGDVSMTNNLVVTGTTTTLNLNTTGAVNLGDNAIQSTEIENEAITSAKIGSAQVTAEKLHPMGASNDQYLMWNGTTWGPADMPGGLNYLGTWNASTNTPYITNSIGSNSDYYVVSVAGSQNLGSGAISFNIGDWVIHNGVAWEKINNSNDVNSVFGRTGTITAQFGDYTWSQIDRTSSSISDITDVNAASPSSGQLLVSNGTQWINTSVSGDVNFNSSGNLQINPGAIQYNDLRNASGAANTIITWNGVSWAEALFTSLEGDASATNELQDLSLSGNTLRLSSDATSVNLAPYLDNTDEQDLSLTGTTLSISDGNSVDLSTLPGSTDDQELTLTGSSLSIEDGNSVSLTAFLDNTDAQDLSLSGNTLSLTGDATSVSLTPYLDNTDEQDLSLTGTTLSISDGNSVDLSTLPGNTDDQELTLTESSLSIEDGNSVSLAPFLDNTDAQDLSLSGDILSLTGDATTVSLATYLDNTDEQNLSLSINTLSLTNDATTVDLSGYLDNTDEQDLTRATLTGTSLEIEIENGLSATVDLASLVDDDDADNTNELITDVSVTGDFLNITDAGQTWTVNVGATSSDYRLKENIIQTRYGLKDLLSINVYDYDFISGAANQTGFMAQELYEKYPSAVYKGGENIKTDPWMINYSLLTPLLTKSVQELNSKVELLEKQNEALLQENEKMRSKLTRVQINAAKIDELEALVKSLINSSK